MRVFFSWSGEKSREIAEIFSEWLPSAIQAIKPFFSPDIDKGERWWAELASQLDSSSIGLLFLTPDNLETPWLMFEAGAISKKIGQGKVLPILFGVETTDTKGPLAQFQSTPFNRKEMLKLFNTLNQDLQENALAPSVLENTFDKWWPDVEERVKKAIETEAVTPKTEIRTERDLIEEVLTLSREFSKKLAVQAVMQASVRPPVNWKLWDEVLDPNFGIGVIQVFKAMEDGTSGIVIQYGGGEKYIYPFLGNNLKRYIRETPRPGPSRKPEPPPVDDDLDESDPFADE